MADVDIDPFCNHNKPDTQPNETGESILLTLGGVIGGGSTWEPELETLFKGGKTQLTRLKEVQVEGLYRKLSEITC